MAGAHSCYSATSRSLIVDGGSSDLPSEWVWNQRGKGWAQYLQRTMGKWRGLVTGSVLVGGFVGRAIIYTVVRRRVKERELATYSRSFGAQWRASD